MFDTDRDLGWNGSTGCKGGLCCEGPPLAQEFPTKKDLFLKVRDESPSADRPLPPFGRYRAHLVLGTGGWATVYLALQAAPVERLVSIKVLHRENSSQKERSRFHLERKNQAILSHPHIAGYIDSGMTEDGDPFTVLEYVHGYRIDHFCNRLRLSVRERVALFTTMARAVQYMHHFEVIHRDLKPGNILVETSGCPKIIDFGISKNVARRPDRWDLTEAGEVIGTRRYMSPEQCCGHGGITFESEIYTLGVILNELLSGGVYCNPCLPDVVLPSEGIDQAESPDLIAQQRSAPFSKVRAQLRGDLDAIVERACQFSPKDRYSTTDAFVADLDAYLEGRALSSRSSSALYVTGRRLKTFGAVRVPILPLVIGLVILVAAATLIPGCAGL